MKQKLLNTALRLFSEEGYNAAGTQKIIDEVGVTKPTLYHYFGSKAGILREIMDNHSGNLLPELTKASTYNGDLVWCLENTMETLFHMGVTNEAFFRLLLTLNLAPPKSEEAAIAAGFLAEIHKILEALFIAAEPQHGNIRGKSHILSHVFFSTAGTYLRFFWNRSLQAERNTAYLAVKQFMHGIYS
ncbi:MAG: TetR/AcrR family transcriptional regulator [Spirochaetales bacterium]|nr:TetR/AcrR family transcriptional regulator [Spirochaetales bacterium]